MLQPRVIPVLLLKNEGLYKGVKFKDHRYVGDPINTVKIFNEKEVDEIVFLDITATLEQKEPNYKLLERIASEAFMPFAYGGGVRSLEQANRLFQLGVEKIILNTAAIETPELITEIANHYGNQAVVVSIDVTKNWVGQYRVCSRAGTKQHKIEIAQFAQQMQTLGAGEVMLSSIDRDGTMVGYDLSLIKLLSSLIEVPLIASGGCGSLDHISAAVSAGASAAAAGSFFVFQGKHRAVLVTYPAYDEIKDCFREGG